jgi:hypothetical protein
LQPCLRCRHVGLLLFGGGGFFGFYFGCFLFSHGLFRWFGLFRGNDPIEFEVIDPAFLGTRYAPLCLPGQLELEKPTHPGKTAPAPLTARTSGNARVHHLVETAVGVSRRIVVVGGVEQVHPNMQQFLGGTIFNIHAQRWLDEMRSLNGGRQYRESHGGFFWVSGFFWECGSVGDGD